MIPRNIQFIDGSAFCSVKLLSITIKSGNNTFIVEKDLLIDIHCHKLIHNFSRSSTIHIPSHIEILCPKCFSDCRSLLSISFESKSRLPRIKQSTFSFASLPRAVQSIVYYVLRDVQFIICFPPFNRQWLRPENMAKRKSVWESDLE
jgi:hypothetical protein